MSNFAKNILYGTFSFSIPFITIPKTKIPLKNKIALQKRRMFVFFNFLIISGTSIMIAGKKYSFILEIGVKTGEPLIVIRTMRKHKQIKLIL